MKQAIFALLLFVVGCSGSTPTAPAALDVSGSWNGWAYRLYQDGSMNDMVQRASLTLTQHGSRIAGTLALSPDSAPWTLEGYVEAGRVTGTITAQYATCQMSGPVAGGDVSAGSFTLTTATLSGCPVARPWGLRLDLTR